MIMLMLSVNPNLNLTPQENWTEITTPFSIPRADKGFITHAEQGGGGSCPMCGPCNGGSPSDVCKISYWYVECYVGVACFVVCVYRDKDPSCESVEPPSPKSLTQNDLKRLNEPLTISEDLNQKPYVGFYTIYDLSGRVVFSGNLNGNLPPLKKGVYFLKDKSGKVSRVVIR